MKYDNTNLKVGDKRVVRIEYGTNKLEMCRKNISAGVGEIFYEIEIKAIKKVKLTLE